MSIDNKTMSKVIAETIVNNMSVEELRHEFSRDLCDYFRCSGRHALITGFHDLPEADQIRIKSIYPSFNYDE